MTDFGKRVAVNTAAIFLICLFVFVVNTWWRMKTQFNLGEAAFAKGDYAEAIAGYESALHMYLPFSPTMKRAAERLWYMGEFFEREQSYNHAIIAYRTLRSSFYSAQWLMTPGQDWIDRCDRKIAQLVPLSRLR